MNKIETGIEILKQLNQEKIILYLNTFYQKQYPNLFHNYSENAVDDKQQFVFQNFAHLEYLEDRGYIGIIADIFSEKVSLRIQDSRLNLKYHLFYSGGIENLK